MHGEDKRRARIVRMSDKARDWGEVTVGDVLARGGETVGASCWSCGRVWQAPIVMMPEATSLKKLQGLMRCPTCTRRSVEIWPEWSDDAADLQ